MVNANLIRGFHAGLRALRLDTSNTSEISVLSGSDGGTIFADVISSSEAGLHFPRKHLGLPKYENFVILIGAAGSQGLFDWVAGSWGPNPEAKNGALLSVDANFKIRSEAEFSSALVVETSFPALDAASKEPGYISIHLRPEFIDLKPGAGTLSLQFAKQNLWRTANFRLEIDGLDCTKVSKIDAFTVKRDVTTVASGSGGISLVPGNVGFPNLRITLANVSANPWHDWHKSFVVDGNNGDAFERNGTIRFLSNDLKKELSRIELHHLGIIRIGPEPGGDQIARVTAELYCEEMQFSQGVGP